MTTLLVDPWLTDVSETDHSANDNRFNAISVLLGLQQSTPLEFARFLDDTFFSDFYTRYRTVYRGTFGGILSRFLKHLELNGSTESEPAEFLSGPIPDDCNETWRRVLAEQAELDDAPVWRCPVVMVPEVRDAEWPQEDEINFSVGEGTRVRNLVRIEKYQDHPYFQPDLDPWRLNACGEPIGETRERGERRPTWKRLPRPPELPESLSFDQLQVALQGDINSTNEEGTELYFVPAPIGWNPNEHQRDPWRNCTAFIRKQVQIGLRADWPGYLDRDGRIWVWHDEEGHWDVQIRDVQIKDGQRRDNVSHKGEILRTFP